MIKASETEFKPGKPFEFPKNGTIKPSYFRKDRLRTLCRYCMTSQPVAGFVYDEDGKRKMCKQCKV